VTYTVDCELTLVVEVVTAERGVAGTRWTAPEPDCVELCVRLGDLDVTAALPAALRKDLEDDARERLYWEGQEL